VFVFDTSSFRTMNHYFPAAFPSFWVRFEEFVASGQLVSVREVRKECEQQGLRTHMVDWIGSHGDIFLAPTIDEQLFIRDIFAVVHFQQLINQKNLKLGRPVADPFVIASAKINNACVVTEERPAKNSAKIPNVCEYFGVQCINLESFMQAQAWAF
jgi:Domain of unknown function (DUF4411)